MTSRFEIRYTMKTSICLLLLSLCSCGTGNDTGDKRTRGTKIIFPNNLILLTDEQEDALSRFNRSKARIIHYLDVDCSTCLGELRRWRLLLKRNPIYENVSIIFIAKGSAVDQFKFFVEENDFPFAVYFDGEDAFVEINNLGDLRTHKCILLDKNENIVVKGSPYESPNMLSMYEESIARLYISD